MKVVILYRPNSEHERSVTDFQRDFERQTGSRLTMVSLDTIAGSDMARMYDIVQYPAVVARSNDGAPQKIWQGQMPLINEVSYYTNTAGAGASF